MIFLPDMMLLERVKTNWKNKCSSGTPYYLPNYQATMGSQLENI